MDLLLQMYPKTTHKWEYISRNPDCTRWLVGNSQMANFNGSREYNITYKRGGKILELVSEAEWLVSVRATHIVIDGIQNSVRELIGGQVNLEREVLDKLKEMNKKAIVVLAEALYCPEHTRYETNIHRINRQIKRINREASGLASPTPWTVLAKIKRKQDRREKDSLIIFPDSFARDGYHINKEKILEYEAEIARHMDGMIA